MSIFPADFPERILKGFRGEFLDKVSGRKHEWIQGGLHGIFPGRVPKETSERDPEENPEKTWNAWNLWKKYQAEFPEESLKVIQF